MNKTLFDTLPNLVRVARIAFEFLPVIKRGVKVLDRLPDNIPGEEKAKLLAAALNGAIDGLEQEIDGMIPAVNSPASAPTPPSFLE